MRPPDRWYPTGTRRTYGTPNVGDLIALRHGVWRVTEARDLDLDDRDRQAWIEARMPDLAAWRDRPYGLDLKHVGGATPPDWGDSNGVTGASVEVHTWNTTWDLWDTYPSGRWPMCSCCGEPMPCRAELEDRQISYSLAVVADRESVLPGCCWACKEPVTHRQDSVTYPGDNLDLPGAPAPVFHTRAACWGSASRYELRWLAADPRRERILTYPKCGGILVVHADGSTECTPGTSPTGAQVETQPDCRGHLTHDHGTMTACYVGGNWYAREGGFPGCPRGCKQDGHPGTRTGRRPKRRTPNQPALDVVGLP